MCQDRQNQWFCSIQCTHPPPTGTFYHFLKVKCARVNLLLVCQRLPRNLPWMLTFSQQVSVFVHSELALTWCCVLSKKSPFWILWNQLLDFIIFLSFPCSSILRFVCLITCTYNFILIACKFSCTTSDTLYIYIHSPPQCTAASLPTVSTLPPRQFICRLQGTREIFRHNTQI